MAACEVIVTQFVKQRLFFITTLNECGSLFTYIYNRTARRKATACGQVIQTRRVSGNGGKFFLRLCQVREGFDQLLCVWMPRVVVNDIHIRVFCGDTTIHNQHSIADLSNHAEVVGYKNDGETKFPSQAIQ